VAGEGTAVPALAWLGPRGRAERPFEVEHRRRTSSRKGVAPTPQAIVESAAVNLGGSLVDEPRGPYDNAEEIKASKGIGIASFAPSEADDEFDVNAVGNGRANDGFKVLDIPNFIFRGSISVAPKAVSKINHIEGSDLHHQQVPKTVTSKKITSAEADAFKLD